MKMPKTYFSAPLSKSAKDTEGRIRNIFEGQRRRPAVIVLALVSATALLCGSVVAVRSKSAAASRESEVTAEVLAARVAEITELPRFAYQGEDPYLAAVCEWTVRGGEQARYWEAEVTIPAPLIADVDASNPQDIRVWGNFWSFSYTPRATTLFCVSGGERPGLLHLRAADGGYEVYNEEMVGDGEAYGKDMRRIFGVVRMLKLDALDRETVRAQYLADYVLQNGLPFTQYQDYGWDPVHIPGTLETPESAQRVRYAAPAGWSIDYDLREFSLHSFDENETGLSGVGSLEGISISFERYSGTTAEAVIAMRAEQMEQPTQMSAALGEVPATLLRDGATRGEVVKDTYVLALNETDALAVTARNTYYGVSGDPIVQGGKETLDKTLKTFRLTALGKQEIWANASPETSALAFFHYDGASGEKGWLYDAFAEREILSALSAVNASPVPEWMPELVTLPVYGVEIGGKDGNTLRIAWSNGYLIMQDGSVYRYPFDFAPLLTQKWEDRRVLGSVSEMPCGRYLCQNGDAWIAEHMSSAPALSPDRSDIAMELVSADGGAVTVALSNHGSEAFMYGEDFSLQVKLDGTWYVVPATPGENWGFPSTANILRPSETNEIACSLAMYGELPHGTYRIVKDGLAVEFTR